MVGFPRGLAVIEWLGRVFPSPVPISGRMRKTPMVEVQFGLYDARGHRFGSKIRMTSVCNWMLLRGGSAWRDGEPHTILNLPWETVSARVQFNGCTFGQAYDQDERATYLIPASSVRIHPEFAKTSVYITSATFRDKSAEVIIPCNEIYRAFIGVSSRLSYYSITGGFIDGVNNRFYDPDATKTWIKDRKGHLTLRKYMADADAHHVGLFAFDPFFREQAQKFALDTAAANGSAEQPALVLRPPFSSALNVTLRGLWITTSWAYRNGQVRKRPRFLVLEILHCEMQLPFDDLTFERPGGRPSGDDGNARGWVPKRALDEGRPADGELLIYDDADPDPDQLDFEAFPEEVISVLPSAPVRKQRSSTSDSSGDSRVQVRSRQADGHSSGSGSGEAGYGSVALNTSRSSGKDIPGTYEYLIALINGILAARRPPGVTVKANPSIQPIPWPDGSREAHKWAMIRRRRNPCRRRAMIASVLIGNQWFCVLDIERRANEQFRTHVFRMRDGTPLPGAMLEQALKVCAQTRGTFDDTEAWTDARLASVERRSTKHLDGTASKHGEWLLNEMLAFVTGASTIISRRRPLFGKRVSAAADRNRAEFAKAV